MYLQHLFLPPIGLVEKQLRNFILFNDVISSKWKDVMQLDNNRPESAEQKNVCIYMLVVNYH